MRFKFVFDLLDGVEDTSSSVEEEDRPAIFGEDYSEVGVCHNEFERVRR